MDFETAEISEEEAQIRKEAMEEVFEGKAPVQAADDDDTDIQADGTEDNAPADQKVHEPDGDDGGDLSPADKTLAEINSRLSMLDQLENRLKQTEKRIGAIQNEFYNAKKAAETVADAPSKEEMAVAAKSQEAWDELKEEFPSWADAIDGRIAAKRTNSPDVGKLRENLEAIQGRMITGDVLERRLVSMMHPGWQKTVATPEYKTWLASQPADVQHKAANGETAEEAVEVLNLFKEFKKPKVAEVSTSRKKRLEQAAETKKTTKTTRPPKSEEDMSEAELRQQIAKDIWGD